MIRAVLVQHAQHEGIAAPEHVPREIGARLAQYRCDRGTIGNDRHVAVLTAATVLILAVRPLQIRHLLGQLAHHLTLVIHGMGVERVTGRAEFGALNVRGLLRDEARRRAHEVLSTVVDIEGAEDLALVQRQRRIDQETAGEAFLLTEILAEDLVANRARGSVERRGGAHRPGGEIREDLAITTADGSSEPRHGHVAGRAFVFDGRSRFGMIEYLPPHRGLPVRIPRRVRHHRGPPIETDGHVLADSGGQTAVTGDATVRVHERPGLILQEAGRPSSLGPRGGSE